MAAETAFLVPSSKDASPRDPKSRIHLSQTGESKPMTGPLGRYWRRRLRDGSVVIGKPVVKKSPVVPKARKYGHKEEVK